MISLTLRAMIPSLWIVRYSHGSVYTSQDEAVCERLCITVPLIGRVPRRLI
jgi:hypothetical protein